MLFRVIDLIPEFMPEYRIYPGLPWFCLEAAAEILRMDGIPASGRVDLQRIGKKLAE